MNDRVERVAVVSSSDVGGYLLTHHQPVTMSGLVVDGRFALAAREPAGAKPVPVGQLNPFRTSPPVTGQYRGWRLSLVDRYLMYKVSPYVWGRSWEAPSRPMRATLVNPLTGNVGVDTAERGEQGIEEGLPIGAIRPGPDGVLRVWSGTGWVRVARAQGAIAPASSGPGFFELTLPGGSVGTIGPVGANGAPGEDPFPAGRDGYGFGPGIMGGRDISEVRTPASSESLEPEMSSDQSHPGIDWSKVPPIEVAVQGDELIFLHRKFTCP